MSHSDTEKIEKRAKNFCDPVHDPQHYVIFELNLNLPKSQLLSMFFLTNVIRKKVSFSLKPL
jgi:hypothetical protein